MFFRDLYYKLFAAILLLISFQLPVLVTKVSHLVRKMEIRHQVKCRILNGVSDEEITILTFHKKDLNRQLRWEHELEFEYQKMMYDIVSKTDKGDSITYNCWADIEESSLNDEINLLVEATFNSDPSQKKTEKIHFEFLKKLFYKSVQQPQLSNFDLYIYRKVIIGSCQSKYITPYIDKKSPPPKKLYQYA
jgi:hypothetical protein